MNLSKFFFFSCVSLFLIISTSSNYVFSDATPEEPLNILVLNSYHFTYPWTFNQNLGINERISQQYPDAVIHTEFLDWKRYPDDSLIQDLYHLYLTKFQTTSIDLILTTDDKALIFALENREKLFSNAPIAFSGIIEFTAKEIIGNSQNVTGVYEQMDPNGALQLLDILQPSTTDIYLIHDLSESGYRTGKTVHNAVEAHQFIKTYQVQDLSELNFNNLLTTVSTLPENSVIFMVSYNISPDGRKEKPEIFGQLLSKASSVPIYSIDEFLLGNGILGGTFLSGNLQGMQLADLGILILEGTPADLIPHVSDATVYSAIDETVLDRFKLDKKLLSDNVLILNEKFSFYETYKTTVWITISIFSALLVLISLLVVNIQKRRQYALEILSNKDELQVLYEQVQTSEEELLAQNEELESYQEQLKHEAHYDALTNLANRLQLSILGKQRIEQAKQSATKIVLFFIDLNNFRYINNTHGHSFGDKLLQSIAYRLTRIATSNSAFRLGGDEFVMLIDIDPATNDLTIKTSIDELRHIFILPFRVNEITIPITASIGYSIYPDDGHSIEQLISQADMAMYETKKDKKNYAQRFDAAIQFKYDEAFTIISKLEQAYENKEFVLHYQPQIDIKTHTIVGFEALLRWNSPEFGTVPPSKFIPLAESSGFIKTIGACVIKNALQFAKRMKSLVPYEFKVSVNVSVIQLFEEGFIETCQLILQEEGISSNYLQFEITESVMIESYDLIIERLNGIRALGISLSLDDFGTGYSSLIYLHHLPISELKIDKIFVDELMNENEEHHQLINTILTLAKSYNLCVVAEGVEDSIQVDYLRAKGCDRIQGYYYSKPIPIEDVIVYCSEFSVLN
jgi:diguanylate cyclase (GGDEF)-like protein